MQYYWVILFTLVHLFIATSADKPIKSDDTKGFYWRDFVGVIPKDAFPGGLDVNGSISYVGQALYNNLLVPGEIVASEKKIYYEWGFMQFESTENVKILCTQHPEQLYWVITTNKDFKTLVHKHFVSGGYEPENRIYIGRTSDGSKRLGKVQVRTLDENAILHFTENRKGVFRESFEILVLAVKSLDLNNL